MSSVLTSASEAELNKQFQDEYLRVRHIQDSVHGYIPIPKRIEPLLDTREFQRLRSLKQLGTSYYIFPGASHNRFEHCIGVMHLAGKMIDKLAERQPSLKVTDSEKYCVRVAGLLHDLGHGPFSHVFDHEVMREFIERDHRKIAAARRMSLTELKQNDKEIRNSKFRHEDMSAKLTDSLFESVKERFLDNDEEYEITDDEIALIKAIITPSSFPEIVKAKRAIKRQWLFQIVANDTCGIDVDRWDYLRRDSDNCNVSVQFKYDRILEHCRVVNGDICYEDKVHFEISLLFTARYELFKRVYSHKTSKGIEFQVCDAMIMSDHHFQISDKVKTAQGYLALDDHIIKQIANVPIPDILPSDPAEKKSCLRLRKAKNLARRIEIRDLYRCVQYISLNAEDVMLLINRSKFRRDNKISYSAAIERSDESREEEGYCEGPKVEIDPSVGSDAVFTPVRVRSASVLFGETVDGSPSPKTSKSVKIPYGEGMRLFEKDLFAILELSDKVEVCRGGQQGDDGQLIECKCLEEEYDLEMKAKEQIKELKKLRKKMDSSSSIKGSGIAPMISETELQSTPPDSRMGSTTSSTTSPSTEESTQSVASVDREWKTQRKIHLRDIRVQLMSLHYGKETSHPIQDVKFYRASHPYDSFHARPEQVSRMLEDACHREIIFRVYTTERMWVEAVADAVMKFHQCYDVVRAPKEENLESIANIRPSTFSPMTSKGRRKAQKRRSHQSGGLSGDHQKKRRRTGIDHDPSEGNSSDSSSGIGGTDGLVAQLSFHEESEVKTDIIDC